MQELTLQYCQASDASVAVASSFAVFKQGKSLAVAKNKDQAGGKTLVTYSDRLRVRFRLHILFLHECAAA